MVWWVPIESQGNETTVCLKAVDIADEDWDNLVSFLDPKCPTRDEPVLNLHNEGGVMEGYLLHRRGAFPSNKDLSSRSSVTSFKFLVSVSLDVRRKTRIQQLLPQTGPATRIEDDHRSYCDSIRMCATTSCISPSVS